MDDGSFDAGCKVYQFCAGRPCQEADRVNLFSNNPPWRRCARLLLMASLLSLCGGCATEMVTIAARDRQVSTVDPVSGRAQLPRSGPDPRAAYYALLPLAVPFDVLTLPIQYAWMRAAFP